MNILPHKSWHVRTKANIERVRRDEEKAAEEEKERQRRIALAEQEARTELLRKKAEGRRALENGESSAESSIEAAKEKEKQISLTSEGSRHINFFSNIEESERLGPNKDYEAEKKEEKEKHEKSIGLLTYLGQSAVEAQTSKPWYFKAPEKSQDKSSKSKKPEKISDQEFDVKTKSKLDPMNDMMRFLEKKRKVTGDKDDVDYYRPKKRHKKDRERDLDRRSSSSASSSSSSKSSSSGGSKSMEQLRAERLKREKDERLKQEKLMAKVRGVKLPEEQEEEVDDRSRRYNQQYNPDLVRKPKKRKDYTDYREYQD